MIFALLTAGWISCYSVSVSAMIYGAVWRRFDVSTTYVLSLVWGPYFVGVACVAASVAVAFS